MSQLCSQVLQLAALAEPGQTTSRRHSTTDRSKDIQAACRAACGQQSPFRPDTPPFLLVVDEVTAALAPAQDARLRTRFTGLFSRARR